MSRQYVAFAVSYLMMSILFGMIFSYFFDFNVYRSLVYGFVVSFFTVMIHEISHEVVALYYCKYRDVEFTITSFAIELTLFSIFILSLLIVIKNAFGWKTWVLPVVASPGAVVVERFKRSNCGDDVAIAGPLINFIVGLASLILLYGMTNPPFILNGKEWWTTLLALISYFSFALSFFNTLPLKVGSVALDGWNAVFLKPKKVDIIVLDFLILITSFIVLFTTGWWCVVK